MRSRFRAATFRPRTPLLLAAMALAIGGCAGAPDRAQPAEARRNDAVLKEEWRLYLADSPDWPEARARWLDGPPAERRLLLDNLLIELLQDDAAGRGAGTTYRSTRARRELTWFGSDAVAPLATGMRALGSRERVDGVALERIAGALAELRAAEPLAELAAPDPSGKANVTMRVAAVRALAIADDEVAQAALIARLQGDPDWQVRGAAAECLRPRASEPAVRRAMAAALGDVDGFVRAQAVRSLVVGGGHEIEAIPIDTLARCLTADAAPAVRAAAAESLGLYAYAEAVETLLLGALRDRDLGVVGAAAHALFNSRTPRVQLALVDALERVNRIAVEDASAAGLVSELLRLLAANVGATPERINPAGWRALIEQRAQER